jgi:diphosphomevalonate decarboxylase
MLKTSWSAPSNIALVKYWGKHADQLPINSSISMSLKNCFSTVSVSVEPISATGANRVFYFEGKISSPEFSKKFDQFLNKMALQKMPWINHYNLLIESSNTFPHSTGIASSASALAALALCILDLDIQIKCPQNTSQEKYTQEFFQQASQMARIGSGSACRSLYTSGMWGRHQDVRNSSDEWAINLETQTQILTQDWADAVLIVNSNEKKISSSNGHNLMTDHALKTARIKIAQDNLTAVLQAVQQEDWSAFGKILESEAMWLHALMMTSSTPYMLMEGATIELLKRLMAWRDKHNILAYFTLDAGPNIHLIYHKKFRSEVCQWIETQALDLLSEKRWIDDQFGGVPVKNNDV